MDAAAATWWEAVEQGRLVVQRCAHCDVVQHPPGPWCRTCTSASGLEWTPHPGTGRLVSFTQVHRSTYPELEVPYWIAMVELAPGAVMVANLVAPDEHADGGPRIGDAVHLGYSERGGRTLPVFALGRREETR